MKAGPTFFGLSIIENAQGAQAIINPLSFPKDVFGAPRTKSDHNVVTCSSVMQCTAAINGCSDLEAERTVENEG